MPPTYSGFEEGTPQYLPWYDVVKTFAERLSSFVFDLTYDRLPTEVRRQAKMILYDGLGLILSGYRTEHGDIIHHYVEALNHHAEASIVGYGTKTDCMNAALANGILAYTHDYSDTVLECVVHCEPVVVPTVLAMGERAGIDGKSLITALVAGYEVMTRVAMAVNSGANRMRHQGMGFHPTSTCGVFGAAAAAGKILGSSTEQLCDSLGLAGSMASGILEALTSTPISMARRLSGGKGAFSGILSAFLASNGFTGPKTVFEGENGFLRAYTNGHFDVTSLESIEADRFYIMDAAVKFHNCTHAAAPSIDALLDTVAQNTVAPEDIEKVVARIPSSHHRIFSAKKDMYQPLTYGDAQTSLPYCLAIAALYGEVCVDQFNEDTLRDEVVLRTARKVELLSDTTLDEAFDQGKWPAEIELTVKGGRRFVKRVDFPKGSPNNAMSREEYRSKFDHLSRASLRSDQRQRVTEAVEELESLQDVASLLALTVCKIEVGRKDDPNYRGVARVK